MTARKTQLITAASLAIGGLLLGLLGCEPNQSGTAGGYHSTSSEQNVGSRSSHGLYGGTVDQTGTAGGGTYGHYEPGTPTTPYSNQTTPANGTTPPSTQPGSTGAVAPPTTPYNGGATLPPSTAPYREIR
jgi:hypothetical protein